MTGTLYLVSTHIGNFNDLTFRAKRIITECDFIICEELKPARSLLKNLSLYKELIELNEHNEEEVSPEIINLLKSGKNCALISDAGSPIFSDPGRILVNLARSNQIPISIVPGPDSLIPSLISSGFDVSKFFFAGWLSRKSEERKEQLVKLKRINSTIAIMDTPYRIKQLLSDLLEIFADETEVCIACDLTTENEKFIRGNLKEVYNEVMQIDRKFEFILIINNRKGS